MPLKKGYGDKTIADNIREMIRAGYSPEQSKAAALTHARADWFKKFPHGFLPYHLASPKTARNRSDYTPSGALKIKENPRPNTAGIDKARRLFESFTGQAAKGVKLLKIRPVKEGVAIGKILGIIYSVEATGEKFRHSFKATSRPHLVVSADGHQVIICGGKFTFTERGFMDH